MISFAQAPIGAIAGVISDESGGVAAGATVTVANKARGLKRERKSDTEGSFSAPALPAGFTLSTLMRILPQVKAQAAATPTNPNPNDLTLRNINVTKQGTDLFQNSDPASYARRMPLGAQRGIVIDLAVTADFVYRHFYNQEIRAIDCNRFNRARGPAIPPCTSAQAADPRAN